MVGSNSIVSGSTAIGEEADFMVELLPLCCCVTRATQGEKVETGVKAAPEKVLKLRRN